MFLGYDHIIIQGKLFLVVAAAFPAPQSHCIIIITNIHMATISGFVVTYSHLTPHSVHFIPSLLLNCTCAVTGRCVTSVTQVTSARH